MLLTFCNVSRQNSIILILQIEGRSRQYVIIFKCFGAEHHTWARRWRVVRDDRGSTWQSIPIDHDSLAGLVFPGV
jgi:hypothetical protein